MAGAGVSQLNNAIMSRILVTGASGFVGNALCGHLASVGHDVLACVRQRAALNVEQMGDKHISLYETGELFPHTNWRTPLTNLDVVVHLAARVHVMRDGAADRLALYRSVNTDTTLNLARQAAKAGVRRFVFISTVKVHGEGRENPYAESDLPLPQDAYAISKWEAEQGLHTISAETGMEVVILRPPLVYGPGVKANFLRLMQLIERGWPLPLGAVHNRRSLLYLGNLVSAIAHCIEHPAAAGKVFLVSDGEAISTPDLIRLLAGEMGRSARLLPVPSGLLRFLAGLVGKRAEANRLLDSLVVDSSKLMKEYGWRSPFSLQAGIRETVHAYLNQNFPLETPSPLRGGWVKSKAKSANGKSGFNKERT